MATGYFRKNRTNLGEICAFGKYSVLSGTCSSRGQHRETVAGSESMNRSIVPVKLERIEQLRGAAIGC
jgi:hypothetical protein